MSGWARGHSLDPIACLFIPFWELAEILPVRAL